MSELRADSRPKTSTAFWRIYMLSWAVLAGGALTYLITQTTPPGALGTNLATARGTNNEAKRAELDREQLSAQVRSLNETVATLRTDLAKFKQSARDRSKEQAASLQTPVSRQASDVQPEATVPSEVSNITTASLPKPDVKVPAPDAKATDKSEAAPSDQVTTINRDPAAPSAAQPSVPSNPTSTKSETTALPTTPSPVEAQPRRRRNLATTLLRPGRLPPLPPFSRHTAAQVANPIANNTTSKPVSVVKTAAAPSRQTPAFGTRVIKHRQPIAAAALSLSTAQSVTGLRASWLLLRTRHPNIFVGYQPRYVADQANGYYRLLAGPITNHSDADRICTELRAQNVSCGVTAYIGSAL